MLHRVARRPCTRNDRSCKTCVASWWACIAQLAHVEASCLGANEDTRGACNMISSAITLCLDRGPCCRHKGVVYLTHPLPPNQRAPSDLVRLLVVLDDLLQAESRGSHPPKRKDQNSNLYVGGRTSSKPMVRCEASLRPQVAIRRHITCHVQGPKQPKRDSLTIFFTLGCFSHTGKSKN